MKGSKGWWSLQGHERWISCRQHSIDKHKGAHYFSTESLSNGVTRVHTIHCTLAISVKLVASLDAPCNYSAANGSQALCHNVGYSSRDGHLLCNKKTKRNSWVNVSTCNTQTNISSRHTQKPKPIQTTEAPIAGFLESQASSARFSNPRSAKRLNLTAPDPISHPYTPHPSSCSEIQDPPLSSTQSGHKFILNADQSSAIPTCNAAEFHNDSLTTQIHKHEIPGRKYGRNIPMQSVKHRQGTNLYF